MGLVGRPLDCLREASRDAAPGNERSIRSCCVGTEALGYDFPLIINVIDSRTVGWTLRRSNSRRRSPILRHPRLYATINIDYAAINIDYVFSFRSNYRSVWMSIWSRFGRSFVCFFTFASTNERWPRVREPNKNWWSREMKPCRLRPLSHGRIHASVDCIGDLRSLMRPTSSYNVRQLNKYHSRVLSYCRVSL